MTVFDGNQMVCMCVHVQRDTIRLVMSVLFLKAIIVNRHN